MESSGDSAVFKTDLKHLRYVEREGNNGDGVCSYAVN
jgi:hypothetical protein